MKRHFGFGLLMAVLFCALPTMGLMAQTTGKSPTKITIEELTNAYEKNPMRADKKYKYHYLQVSGIVDMISAPSDPDEEANILLGTGDALDDDVTVYFKHSEHSKLEDLSKGDNLTVVGYCGGTDIMDDVTLNNSIIIKHSAGTKDKEDTDDLSWLF